MYKYLIPILLLVGCGDGLDESKYVEKEMQSYVEKFKLIYGKSVNIEIKFEDLDPMIAGVCYSYTDPSFNYIEIDRDLFSTYSELGREELIFHELGHCILDREHTTSRIAYKDTTIPKSIMYPYIFGGLPFYAENLSYYYDELIKGK